MLSILNTDMHCVVEPGVYEMMVGPSSDNTKTARLTVNGPGGNGQPPLPPPPSGSESGLVSNFDEGKVAANYGMWVPASDSMNGGKSKSAFKIVEPGANGTKGALEVDGEVLATGGPFSFAGALFSPGPAIMQAVNLSNKKTISFWAKGDGKNYVLLVLTDQNDGSNSMPAMKPFVAGPEWKEYTFPFSDFETDGSDLKGLGFLHAQEPGTFSFQIDQVEIK
jgi:hypothetical protein